MNNFGEYLRQQRKERNISLNELARRAKVDPGNLSRLERGERTTPSAEMLARIADGLNKPRAEIFTAAGYLDYSDDDQGIDIKEVIEKQEKAHWGGLELDDMQREIFKNYFEQILKAEQYRNKKLGDLLGEDSKDTKKKPTRNDKL